MGPSPIADDRVLDAWSEPEPLCNVSEAVHRLGVDALSQMPMDAMPVVCCLPAFDDLALAGCLDAVHMGVSSRSAPASGGRLAPSPSAPLGRSSGRCRSHREAASEHRLDSDNEVSESREGAQSR